MNWERMKNVMIVFLVAVNLVLLVTLYSVETANTSLSKEAVANAVRLLENHGIRVDETVIPSKSESMGTLPMIAAVDSHERFATVFLGTTYEHQKEAETGTHVYTYDGRTIRLNGGYVKYYSGREQGGAASEEIWRSAKARLEESGIDLSSAIESRVSDYETVYRQQYKGKSFFEGILTVTADESGILSVEGFWMIPGGAPYDKEYVGLATDALSAFLKDQTRLASSVEITDISLGYSVLLGESEINFSEATAIPVWRLATADGMMYYYDAREQ